MLKRALSQALACCAVFLSVSLIALSASAAPTDGPVGAWTTENGHGVIAIDRCGDALCGRIVGIDRAPDEPIPTDVHGNSQCGLTIITNEKPDSDGSYLGQITDPRDGNTYQAKIWLGQDGNLRLRGFLGIPLLGSTQVWRPFTGHLAKECMLT
jgi:uncharacterized protein (DUF2147 family)